MNIKLNKTVFGQILQILIIGGLVSTPFIMISYDILPYDTFSSTNDAYTRNVLLYIALLLILITIFKIHSYHEREQFFYDTNLSKRLQLRFLRKQLDSHFTFNVLNTLSASILRDDRKEAYKQLIIFSKVLRHSFDKTESLTYTLEQELNFIQNYLQLEKYRYKDKFNYTIKVDDNVNKLRVIPKRLIQQFISNSIKHGIMPLNTGGIISLHISYSDNSLKIVVIDNGIGRKKASTNNKLHSPGQTLNFVKELFKIFNKYNKDKLQYHYFDTYKNGENYGTKVTITIPDNFDFNIY